MVPLLSDDLQQTEESALAMDSNRFDDFTRTFSRRRAMGMAGVGGLLMALTHVLPSQGRTDGTPDAGSPAATGTLVGTPSAVGTPDAATPSGTVCPDDREVCGTVCCPNRATCVSASTGVCSCPGRSELCGGVCMPSCPLGSVFDTTNCQCL